GAGRGRALEREPTGGAEGQFALLRCPRRVVGNISQHRRDVGVCRAAELVDRRLADSGTLVALRPPRHDGIVSLRRAGTAEGADRDISCQLLVAREVLDKLPDQLTLL